MKEKTKKPINHYIRSLHRDIGFFLIGLVVIYCLSGVLLIFRDTDYLKSEKHIQTKLELNLPSVEIGKALHIKGFKVIEEKEDIILFKNGTYNKTTGNAEYKSMEYPAVLKAITNLHKTPSKKITHWFNIVFGVLLFFLAISSFWMFKTTTKMFKRGLYISSAGIVFSIILLFFQ